MKFLICALLLSQACFGQANQKTIVVQGKAKMRVKPDIAFIRFSIEKSDTSQSKAMAKANEQIETLSVIMMQQGLLNKQIKASEYYIRKEYNDAKRKTEYSVSNSLIATIPMNGKLINELLKGVEAKKINGVEISFEYALSDTLEKAMRIQLVQNAVANAKINAENISQALKLQLKTILKVSKGDREPIVYEKLGEFKVTTSVIKRDTDIKFDSVFGNYDVEDKELTEEITIIYEVS